MTIDKAIEILSLDLSYTYPAYFADLQDAIKLAKESLIRFNKLRQVIIVPYTAQLPGEDPQ